MSERIIADFDLCAGCDICRLACSEATEGGYNPRAAKLRIEDKMKGLVSEPIVCNQCENAYCLQVCPTEAITRESELDIPKIDEDVCVGCGLCQEYCPKDVIVITNNTAAKCELCDGDPACVKHCPTGALKFISGGDKDVQFC